MLPPKPKKGPRRPPRELSEEEKQRRKEYALSCIQRRPSHPSDHSRVLRVRVCVCLCVYVQA